MRAVSAYRNSSTAASRKLKVKKKNEIIPINLLEPHSSAGQMHNLYPNSKKKSKGAVLLSWAQKAESLIYGAEK